MRYPELKKQYLDLHQRQQELLSYPYRLIPIDDGKGQQSVLSVSFNKETFSIEHDLIDPANGDPLPIQRTSFATMEKVVDLLQQVNAWIEGEVDELLPQYQLDLGGAYGEETEGDGDQEEQGEHV